MENNTIDLRKSYLTCEGKFPPLINSSNYLTHFYDRLCNGDVAGSLYKIGQDLPICVKIDEKFLENKSKEVYQELPKVSQESVGRWSGGEKFRRNNDILSYEESNRAYHKYLESYNPEYYEKTKQKPNIPVQKECEGATGWFAFIVFLLFLSSLVYGLIYVDVESILYSILLGVALFTLMGIFIAIFQKPSVY